VLRGSVVTFEPPFCCARSRSRSALVGPLDEQVEGVENEAGVRKSL